MGFHATAIGYLVSSDPAKARAELAKALERNHGDVSATAKALGVTRQTLYNWLHRLDTKEAS